MWNSTSLTADICKEFRRLHGMELTSCKLIEKVLDNNPAPALVPRLKDHLWDTQWQVGLVKSCTELLGETGTESLQLPDRALWGAYADIDTLLAYKKFEISNYQSAIVIARKAGVGEIADICQELLDCEKNFNGWLQKQSCRNIWVPASVPAYAAPVSRPAFAAAMRG